MNQKRLGFLCLGLVLAAAGSAIFFASPATAGDPASAVERGRYLVSILDCNACHTPFKLGPNGPEPDMARMLSGHPEQMKMGQPPVLGNGPWIWAGAATNTAFAGPWGITYAANLTPDEYSGIGIWTEEIFMKTLRTGKHWGTSRAIQPPMPWQAYSQMTDEDMKAVYAFLKSIPPIRNRVPDYAPPAQK